MAKLFISIIFTMLICNILAKPAIVDDDVIDLSPLGPGIYGVPSNRTGDLIAKWTPELGNPDQLGEYFEGDILHPIQDGGMSKSGLIALSTRWPNKIIPFVFEFTESLSFNDQLTMVAAMIDFHTFTCIRFTPRTSETDYLRITNLQTGCWSSVGRIGGAQQLNLQTPGCTYYKGIPIHEFMHALGIVHEQSRTDRDSYVRINEANISPGSIHNFYKYSDTLIQPFGQPYDYNSIMHYDAVGFSSNGLPTITTLQYGAVIGQRHGFSLRDVLKIRAMYQCA